MKSLDKRSALYFFCAISSALATSSPFQDLKDRDDLKQPGVIKSRQGQFDYFEGNPTISFDRTLTNRRNEYERNQSYFARENYYRENYEPLRTKETAGVFRTHGRGKAQVTRHGETVNVPNQLRRRAYKGSISIRIVDKDENEAKANRQRGGCKECPTDQTVVATKGNDFVILPEPCPAYPRMWNHHSGPKPGTKIREGVHVIRGTIGHKKRYCQYQYQVIVRNCEPLKPQDSDMIIECSAGRVWGSMCTVSCGGDKELIGETDMECQEDEKWSNPLPVCKGKWDCPTPKVKANSKISCQTSNMTQVEGDYLPNRSICRFKKNGRDVSIKCKEGTWRMLSTYKTSMAKKNQLKKQKIPEENVCNPNPCQNGGTCLKSESNKGPFVCHCRPQTHGLHCEMRECDYNICQNDGLCFFQNDERTCYCIAEYNGDRCQYYKPFE